MGLPDDPRSDYDRGVEAGRIEQRLDGFDKHFAAVNGSIDRCADRLTELGTGIGELREDARLRDERVAVAAATLAQETERRRAELVEAKDAAEAKRRSSDRQFTRRERGMGLAFSALVVLLGLKDFLG